MTAAVTAPTLAPQPDDTPTPRSRLLRLVRKLIDYGRELASTVRQCGGAALSFPASRFDTGDLPLILARITRGLRIAAMLESKLDSMQREPRPSAVPLPRVGGGAKAAAATTRPSTAADTRLPDLPTPEQIAALIRRKPIGAVIADICRDLGILPCHPLWQELQDAIIRYGGNLAQLVGDILDRTFPLAAAAARRYARRSRLDTVLAGTGPPG